MLKLIRNTTQEREKERERERERKHFAKWDYERDIVYKKFYLDRIVLSLKI